MNFRRKFRRAFVVAVVGLAELCLVPGSARAQSARAIGPTPPRLAFIDGQVSFWRPGAEDWAPAQVNTALAAGDTLYVADGGNAEIEIGSRAYVRAGSGTQLAIASLETGYLQLEVTSGHCAVDLARMPEGQEIEVDSPSGAFTIERPGYYRTDVDDDTTFTVRNGGVATVVPAGGESTDVVSDRQVVLRGTDTATVSVNAAPPPDEWDRWNADRSGRHPEKPRAAEYVPPPVSGVDDLDGAGDWNDTPDYGHVWIPRDVAPDWAPYSTGRWVWDPYYEWTWVDDAPWGWAPYHYGRWCRVQDRWGWAPGPLIAAPVYSPALVTFFGGGGVSVSVGAPFVSWVALGWGEPILPWWGPVGFHGRPYWGGWGGPRVVNNVVINNTTIVNARNIDHFSNVNVRNAVVGVPRDHFGRGGVDHVRIPEAEARRLQPLRGSIGVRPTAASLVPNVGHAQRPPDRVQARHVIATRPPQDPTPRLHAAGLEPRGPVRRPEARVVTPTRGPQGQAPVEHGEQPGKPQQGQQGSRPEHGGRMVAPPSPGHEGAAGRSAEHGRQGQRGPLNEGTAPDAGHGVKSAPGGSGTEPRDGKVEGEHAVPPVPPVPNGERGRKPAPNDRGSSDREQGHRAAPPLSPPERAPIAPPDHVNDHRVPGASHGRPDEPRAVVPPVGKHGEQSTPHGRDVAPPAPPQHPTGRVAPAPQHPTERVAPPPQHPAERVAPPPRTRSDDVVPPSHGHVDRAAPPPRERSERMPPPPRENPSERAVPPARANSPPAHERVQPPAKQPRERPAPVAPPPVPPPPQAVPKAPNAAHGKHQNDAKQPNEH